MNESVKKILFINFGGIGDEILFLPTIISIKKEFPNSHITLALEPRSKGIATLTDTIDETLYADIKGKNKFFSLFKLLLKIWTKNFDMVISSGSNKLISMFLFATFIKKRYGYDSGKLSHFLLTKAIKLNKNQYAGYMYHDLIRSITDYNTLLPEINIQPREKEPNTVLIHPGVSLMSIKKGMVKTVSKEVWAEVTEKLADRGKKVIVAGGPDDRDVIEYITQKVPSEKFVNTYGQTKNLKELAELISKAEIFLCSDSAPLHIASALRTKTFAIFGSTDDKKLIPPDGNITPVKSKTCTCALRPCLWDKRQTTCESLECLKISSDEIVETVT